MKAPAWVLLLIVVLLAGFQRASVFSAPRRDLFGSYEAAQPVDSPLVAGEERQRMNAANDLWYGTSMPWIDYQYANYTGGSLVVSTLMAPLLPLFGSTAWTLRIFALALQLLSVVLIFAILDRWASRRAAVFGGLLYALTTPGFLINSMMVWGTHVESNVLALLCLWLYLKLQAGERPQVARRILLGIGLGLNVYIGYQSILFVGMFAFFDLFPRWRPRLLEFAGQVAGFVIGMIPWLWYNLRNDFSGLEIYGQRPEDWVAGEGPVGKLWGYFARDWPAAQWFDWAWPEWGPTYNRLYAGVLVLAALIGATRFCRGREGVPHPAHLAAVLLGGFLLAWAVTGFGVEAKDAVFGYRYVLLAMPWVVLAAAAGLDRLAGNQPGTAALAWFATTALAGLCLYASTTTLIDKERFAAERNVSVLDPSGHVLWMYSSYRRVPERAGPLTRRLRANQDPAEFETLMRGLGQKLLWLGSEQPGFAPEQLEFAAQLRALRREILGALPVEMHDWFPEPTTGS
ncbi:MAG: glycosyltransferase family 39 protein [Planctomycetota bacterium]